MWVSIRSRGARFILCLASVSVLGCSQELEQAKPQGPSLPAEEREEALDTWPEQLQAIQAALPAHPENQAEMRLSLLQFEKLMARFSDLKPLLKLKVAELWVKSGNFERGVKEATQLFDADPLFANAARRFVIRYARRCRIISDALEGLVETQLTRELDLIAQVQYATRCLDSKRALAESLTLARAYPRRFTHEELLQLSAKLKPSQVLELAEDWEKARSPQLSLDILEDLLRRDQLSQEIEWEAEYLKLKVQVDRIRSGYEGVISELKRLVKTPKGKGRKARLLLAKALAKSGRIKAAQRAYQELIREWSHSDEAKTARFQKAFLDYEQGRYREAMRGFSELCRHKGDREQLSRYPDRAERGSLTAHAEWYFAWSYYQRDPVASAPFLEAQIGRGLPVSMEGRRAAYWTAQALAHSNPTRAAELRTQLVTAHWGDWYTLLLRAQDPNIAPDVEAWPMLPSPLLPTLDLKVNPSRGELFSEAQNAPKPSLHLVHEDHLAPENLERELREMGRFIHLSHILGFHALALALREEARAVVAQGLSAGDPLENWARVLELYRTLNQQTLSKSPKRLRSPPLLEDEQWWRSVFPLAFQEDVLKASEKTGLSREIILSFIYKESAFEPRAVSHAYAMGLMQLLEKTARALHPDQALPDLLNPEDNIRLGTEYISALASRFHDQLPLIAAAYNAGPSHVVEWAQKGIRKLDQFVEHIPFREAREYVKRLVELRCTYALIYGQRSVNQCAGDLPLHLNLSVEDGVNF